MTCDLCGASLWPGAEWCGQCHQSVGRVPKLVHSRPQVRDETKVVPVYSRWRKGPNTFGPVGRVSWTVGLLVLDALSVFSGDPIAMGGCILIATPLVARSVWARGRIA